MKFKFIQSEDLNVLLKRGIVGDQRLDIDGSSSLFHTPPSPLSDFILLTTIDWGRLIASEIPNDYKYIEIDDHHVLNMFSTFVHFGHNEFAPFLQSVQNNLSYLKEDATEPSDFLIPNASDLWCVVNQNSIKGNMQIAMYTLPFLSSNKEEEEKKENIPELPQIEEEEEEEETTTVTQLASLQKEKEDIPLPQIEEEEEEGETTTVDQLASLQNAVLYLQNEGGLLIFPNLEKIIDKTFKYFESLTWYGYMWEDISIEDRKMDFINGEVKIHIENMEKLKKFALQEDREQIAHNLASGFCNAIGTAFLCINNFLYINGHDEAIERFDNLCNEIMQQLSIEKNNKGGFFTSNTIFDYGCYSEANYNIIKQKLQSFLVRENLTEGEAVVPQEIKIPEQIKIHRLLEISEFDSGKKLLMDFLQRFKKDKTTPIAEMGNDDIDLLQSERFSIYLVASMHEYFLHNHKTFTLKKMNSDFVSSLTSPNSEKVPKQSLTIFDNFFTQNPPRNNHILIGKTINDCTQIVNIYNMQMKLLFHTLENDALHCLFKLHTLLSLNREEEKMRNRYALRNNSPLPVTFQFPICMLYNAQSNFVDRKNDELFNLYGRIPLTYSSYFWTDLAKIIPKEKNTSFHIRQNMLYVRGRGDRYITLGCWGENLNITHNNSYLFTFNTIVEDKEARQVQRQLSSQIATTTEIKNELLFAETFRKRIKIMETCDNLAKEFSAIRDEKNTLQSFYAANENIFKILEMQNENISRELISMGLNNWQENLHFLICANRDTLKCYYSDIYGNNDWMKKLTRKFLFHKNVVPNDRIQENITHETFKVPNSTFEFDTDALLESLKDMKDAPAETHKESVDKTLKIYTAKEELNDFLQHFSFFDIRAQFQRRSVMERYCGTDEVDPLKLHRVRGILDKKLKHVATYLDSCEQIDANIMAQERIEILKEVDTDTQ